MIDIDNLDPDEAVELAKKLFDELVQLIAQNLPKMTSLLKDAIDITFAPKIMARQLLLAITLETCAVTIHQLVHILLAITSNFSSLTRLIRELKRSQSIASTQDEWMDLAERIDSIQHNDRWRSTPTCALYEHDRISSRIDELVHLMRRRDVFDLMFTLRGGIARNKFGLLHEGLFSKALAGTKVLVETYHNVVCGALDFVCDAPVADGEDLIPTDARLAFFNETRHSYGRSALLLSGGAALGFYHVGVVKALMENRLLPRVIGGSSAGSIVCGIIGTRTDEECHRDLFNVQGTNAPGHSGRLELQFFRPLIFSDKPRSSSTLGNNPVTQDLGNVLQNTAGAFHDAKKTWQLFSPIGIRKFTSLLFDILTGHRRPQDLLKSDTEHFRQCCRADIGNFTFQEAFDRTGRILNVIVSPQTGSDPPRLLNYLTAPHVLVWSAVVASSSLPGVFEANQLWVKDADGTERYEHANAGRFQDGSMEADLPMQQLSEMFNINHFIISQANPHAVLLASFNIEKSVWSNPLVGVMNGILLFLKNQCREWMRNMVELVVGRRVAPLWDTRRGLFSQFFTQEYEGRDCDISLIPWIGHRSVWSAFLHCIYNPSKEDFLDWGMAAQRETWKHIPKIKSHVAEEMTLDRCVQRLRKRLLMESYEAKMRLNNNLTTTAGTETTEEKMGKRVPSFFASPSLVNMGGLGIGDPSSSLASTSNHRDISALPSGEFGGGNSLDAASHNYDPGSHHHQQQHYYHQQQQQQQHQEQYQLGEFTEIRSGWGGMGLRGNHSNGSLGGLNSVGSGLFMEASDDERSAGGGMDAAGTSHWGTSVPSGQVAGDRDATTSITRPTSINSLPNQQQHQQDGGGRYIKTTNMANFYYRKSASHNNLSDGV